MSFGTVAAPDTHTLQGVLPERLALASLKSPALLGALSWPWAKAEAEDLCLLWGEGESGEGPSFLIASFPVQDFVFFLNLPKWLH